MASRRLLVNSKQGQPATDWRVTAGRSFLLIAKRNRKACFIIFTHSVSLPVFNTLLAKSELRILEYERTKIHRRDAQTTPLDM